MRKFRVRIKTCEDGCRRKQPWRPGGTDFIFIPISTENMSALANILIAETPLAAGAFPWAWAAFLAVMAFLAVFVALGYRAGWFLPKYRLADADPMHDNLTRKIFGPPEIAACSRRQAQVVPRYQLSAYRSEGFKVVRVAFGREVLFGSQCTHAIQREDGTWEDQVLVARGNRSSAPMSFQERLHELGRSLTGMVRAFDENTKEVRSSRSYCRERLRGLKQRYDALYDEYRQCRAVGEISHTFSTRLNDFETKLKDLNKRLDEMK